MENLMIVTLAGKTAIVTGVVSGIGLAVVLKYHKADGGGIPMMTRQRLGVILNTGLISGDCGVATQGACGPSKGAVHLITGQMATEYAPFSIGANAIACGTVDTPIVHRSATASGESDRFWAMLRDNHPIGRMASLEQVTSFLTGSILMMDGGFPAGCRYKVS
jgi:NAD(P)-dependent dehydrogenase (short-subunit alcohol dehydrogenase family)